MTTEPRYCKNCGKPLVGRQANVKYCEWECRNKFWQDPIKEKLKATRREKKAVANKAHQEYLRSLRSNDEDV